MNNIENKTNVTHGKIVNPKKDDLSFANKRINELVLENWDISFTINGDTFVNVMRFLTSIHTDVPLKFYKDKIFSYLVSPDDIQYAELSISAGDVLDYSAGFYIEDISSILEGNIDQDELENRHVNIDNNSDEFKLIVIDMKDTIDEIDSSIEKDQNVIIRIDTSYHKKIEFHCPDGMIYWSRLVVPGDITKKLDNVYNATRRIRNDTSIPKNVLIVEPSIFIKLSKIGGKTSGKNKDADRITTMNISNDGIFAASGDNVKGRIFILDDIGNSIISNADNNVNITGYEDASNIDNDGDDDIDIINIIDNVNITGHENTNNIEVSNIHPENLLTAEIDDACSIMFSSDYFEPIIKLKGLSPVTVEIRNNKPIVIEQVPYNGIKVFFAVAPRIEKK